jgi:predicted Kef-type K+ transport protein
MDPVWIAIAFLFGFAVRQVGLPPLVGFLIAGFVLEGFGVHGGEVLEEVADLGVTLLLFSIGLKLRLRSLARPEVWAGASIHMIITIVVFGAGVYCLSIGGFSLFSSLSLTHSLMIAFALSFSSTVFAVKVLEERGEMGSLHGRVSIGILIMQDIFAVVFLTISAGKMPSPWALAVPVALVGLRPVLMAIMNRAGHGEMLVLWGLFLALVVGAGGFELVGLKPDLGALILGILVAGHPKASELAKSLLGLKELFLVGFFLTIGLSGTPSLEALGIAVLLVAVVPLKVALFFWLLSLFKLRARTSLLGSLSLANYSEFGLIVGAIGVANGWISSEWLIVIAIALSITFILASPLNTSAHAIYVRFGGALKRFESATRHPEDRIIDPGDATIAVFGMGRIGAAAYDFMRERYGETVIGFDFDNQAVIGHQQAGRKVFLSDATDPDFWERVKSAKISAGKEDQFQLLMLTMPRHTANLYAVQRLADIGFKGMIAATAQFDDEVAELKEHGVHAAFNFYSEAGTGFAEHVWERMEGKGE